MSEAGDDDKIIEKAESMRSESQQWCLKAFRKKSFFFTATLISRTRSAQVKSFAHTKHQPKGN